jgi:hypothetical protein
LLQKPWSLIWTKIRYLDKLADISVKASIIQAYGIVEKELAELLKPHAYETILVTRNRYLPALFRDLVNKGYITRDMDSDFKLLREARNFAAHSPDVDPSIIDWQRAFAIAKELLYGLQKASNSGYTFIPEQEVKSSEDSSNS